MVYKATRVLSNYKHPFIQKVPDKLSNLLCVEDYKVLNSISNFLQGKLLDNNTKPNAQMNSIINSPCFRPIDYDLHPIYYSEILAAISRFHGLDALEGQDVLHIAGNWGLFMYILKGMYHANVNGIDKNELAVQYAKSGGLNFFVGDASKMDIFRNKSFDLVISLNFLDTSYLQFFLDDKITTPIDYIDKVLSEIHRVLRPSGKFISQAEDIENAPSVFKLFRSFRSMLLPHSSPVYILRK